MPVECALTYNCDEVYYNCSSDVSENACVECMKVTCDTDAVNDYKNVEILCMQKNNTIEVDNDGPVNKIKHFVLSESCVEAGNLHDVRMPVKLRNACNLTFMIICLAYVLLVTFECSLSLRDAFTYIIVRILHYWI